MTRVFLFARRSALVGSWIAALAVAIAPTWARAGSSAETPTKTEAPSTGLGDVSLRVIDLAGKIHLIGESAQTRGTALVFITTECPLCRKYVPELNRLARDYAARGIEFYVVIVDPLATRQQAKDFVTEFALEPVVLFDASGELIDQFAPTHVPEAFLFGANRSLAYRGRIDDRYRELRKPRREPTRRDLEVAIESVLAGESVAEPRTPAIGCLVEPIAREKRLADVTYHRDIAPLVLANCAECHRPGEVAPFALLSYDDCAKRGSWLEKVIDTGLMPPWLAEHGHGSFVGDRQLNEFQKSLISAWIEAGMPPGQEADEPSPPVFTEGWRLGEPDVVLEVPYDAVVPADGDDLFQHFVIPIEIPEDKTLIGFEFRPGNRAVVHHAVVFYDTMGAARARDAKTPEPGYTTFGSPGIPVTGVVGVWVPGMNPRFLPPGIGMTIPKGSDVLVQLHLHPTGKKEVDRSRVGLHFADKGDEVRQPMSRVPLVLGSLMIDVPAGESRHRISSSLTIPAPITVTSVVPHMHLIGREMRVTATPPEGEPISLIWIRRWNFYWQDNYVYREPVYLPAGTRIDIEGYFDNSDENPLNPHIPPRRVLFGNDSDEEMFLAMFQTVGHSPEAEQAIGEALLKQFRESWQTDPVKADARSRIIVEAIEFLGGGDVLLKMLLNKPKAADLPLQQGGG